MLGHIWKYSGSKEQGNPVRVGNGRATVSRLCGQVRAPTSNCFATQTDRKNKFLKVLNLSTGCSASKASLCFCGTWYSIFVL